MRLQEQRSGVRAKNRRTLHHMAPGVSAFLGPPGELWAQVDSNQEPLILNNRAKNPSCHSHMIPRQPVRKSDYRAAFIPLIEWLPAADDLVRPC
jgi:hypothetical protein